MSGLKSASLKWGLFVTSLVHMIYVLTLNLIIKHVCMSITGGADVISRIFNKVIDSLCEKTKSDTNGEDVKVQWKTKNVLLRFKKGSQSRDKIYIFDVCCDHCQIT